MMLEIICLSKSGKPSLRLAQNRGAGPLSSRALKGSLLERKMRNKTVNDSHASAGILTEAS
jgi:hypothetical protein